jgi:uncharacterized protein
MQRLAQASGARDGDALNTHVLILPGIGNSGPEHWQTRWESANTAFRRVAQRDWENPVRAEWEAELERAAALSGPDTVLVAHSLACLLVAHWSARTRQRIKAALLVAVPDPDGPAFPVEAIGFSNVPLHPLPFRSIVVASTNDPYGSVTHSQECAAAWGSQLVTIGAAGHINASSGLDSWQEGHRLLRKLMA